MSETPSPAARAAVPPSPYDDGELYDAFFERFRDDLPFWLDFARAGGGPFLDLACGTGRVLIPLLEAGLDGDGVDASEAMLARCRAKADEIGRSPLLVRADMSDFRTPRRYTRAYCAFNAFAHNLDTAAQLGALRRVREQLLDGGAFAVDLGFPRSELWASRPDQRVLEVDCPHPTRPTRLCMYDRRTMDPVAQTQHSEIEIEELDAQGALLARHASVTDLRWIYKNELELLFAAAGFSRWEIYAGFGRERLTADTQQLVAIAWR